MTKKSKKKGIEAILEQLKTGNPLGYKKPNIPEILVGLGTCSYLGFIDGKGVKLKRRPPWQLCTNSKGDELFIFEQQKKSKRIPLEDLPSKAKYAIKRYEIWSDFEPQSSHKTRPIEIAEWRSGTSKILTVINYESAKWSGKVTRYTHTFRTPCKITTGLDKRLLLRFAWIKGKFRVTERGVIG